MAEPVFSADQVNYLKEQMPLWLAEQSLGKPPAVYEIELRERMIRVEEELKYQFNFTIAVVLAKVFL
ncbi:MAG: hypothetical protein D5R98_01220 [Desulfonatronovibrio sp. MSAO_Bac4]|nr:MAG: hypothetical protein D5R98_01220 [Desulfonatronovibrio sp. MSAO_Bac4]